MADTTALKNRIRAAIKANDNQEITGPVLQRALLDMVDELSDRLIDEYGFIGVAIPSTVPPLDLTEYSRVFYLTVQNGVYTNLGGVEVSNEIAVIKYNGSNWSKESCVGIDNEPTAGSNNLVKSGGIAEELALGAVYNVSAKNPTAGPNSDGKFTLEYILSNADTLIPVSVRKGGMSIKFVQSSDNKYVQYRLMKNTWSTTVTNWQGVDEKPTAESDNLVKSGGVKEEINTLHAADVELQNRAEILESKTEVIKALEQYGLYVADPNGNVGFQVVQGLIDALGFGDNLTSILVALIGDTVDFTPINNAIAELGTLLLGVNDRVTEKTQYYSTVEENGLYITDSKGNVAWNFKPYVSEEGGVYFTDDNNNIGFCIKDGKFDFTGFGKNITEYINSIALNAASDNKTVIENYQNIDSNYAQLERIKAEIEESVNSLITVKDLSVAAGDIIERTVTIPASTNNTAVEHGMVRLGLHHGTCQAELAAANGNPAIWDDVYFNGKCRKDFSDIRVLDENDNILPFYMIHHGNYEVCKDNNLIYGGIITDGSGNLYINNKVSYDGGANWAELFQKAGAKAMMFDVDGDFYIFATAQNDAIVSTVPGDIIKVPLVSGALDFSQAAVVCHLWYYSYYYHAAITITGTATKTGKLVLQASPSADYVKRYTINVNVGDTGADICAKIHALNITEWTSSNYSSGNTITIDTTKCLIYIEPEIEGSVEGITTAVVVTKDGATATYPDAMRQHCVSYRRDGHKYVLMASYQTPTNALAFRSIDDGVFTEVLTNQIKYDVTGRNAQHSHFMSYDSVHQIVYIGLDHAANDEYGPTVLKSYDNGTTWIDLNFSAEEINNDRNAYIWWLDRSRDLTFCWFSEDGTFSLGGGETNELGGFTLLRADNSDAASDVTKTDKKFSVVVNTGHRCQGSAIRSLNDNFVVAPLCSGKVKTTAELIMSTDKGKTWNTILHHEDPTSYSHIGNGWRNSCKVTPLIGESHLVFSGSSEDDKYNPVRVYNGGAHYYGEILVDVGNLPAEGKTIKVVNGYAMKYPNKVPFEREIVEPVYSIDFNEGIGRFVKDSEGNIGEIVGEYEWSKREVGYGNLIPHVTDYGREYGLMFKDGAYINFGKISKLNFKNSFTVLFFISNNFRGMAAVNEDFYSNNPFITFGNLGIIQRATMMKVGTKDNNTNVGIPSNQYNTDFVYPLAIRVTPSTDESQNPDVWSKTNELPFRQFIEKNGSLSWTNLSENDLIIGTPDKKSDGGNTYNGKQIFCGIRIYDKALTDAEVDAITFGYTRRLERNY